MLLLQLSKLLVIFATFDLFIYFNNCAGYHGVWGKLVNGCFLFRYLLVVRELLKKKGLLLWAIPCSLIRMEPTIAEVYCLLVSILFFTFLCKPESRILFNSCLAVLALQIHCCSPYINNNVCKMFLSQGFATICNLTQGPFIIAKQIHR